jgi:dihydroflavonol-4-reductase
MRVLVTGGTGFVGSHTVVALRAGGHDVRLLVRDPTRIAHALGPLGIGVGTTAGASAGPTVEHTVGDITDAAAVAAALAGCDAVVHSAGVVTLDPSRQSEARRINVEGTNIVLREACAQGLDPVVHVSSVSALDATAGPMLTPDSPVARRTNAYGGSKAGAEGVARNLQESGAPVTIVYPGGVWGPNDPNLGEQTRAAGWLVRLRVAPQTTGGYPVIDVRDVAAAIAASALPGRGPRRYLLGGTYFAGRRLAALVSELTGRRIFSPICPAWSLRAVGRAGDRLNGWFSWRLPFTAEAMDMLIHSTPTDDSRARAELSISPRDPAVTIADTLRWLHGRGILSARQIGRLAS